ncbi:hypothetical protein [Gimesia aquarii]|uniref:Uncharacterized protein n=1 Tax=Gimesia aquarii TaxID=2527964 RepID=A0A517WYF0_9PLAN|nr:hypothetical protein [Gimesia aquarii]QDU10283.1 hypothetical protein V202x_36820 [Gimesia aquarii]
MKLSLTPFLLLAELAFLLFVFRNANRKNGFPYWRLLVFWLWIVIYAGMATYLGYKGVYVSEALLNYFPGFWLQLITVTSCVAPVLLSPGLRHDLRSAVDATMWEHWIYFNMLRLAAVGTLVGASRNSFPIYFELLVGIPDLLFALSTFWILKRTKADRLSSRQFYYWNLIGAFVIVPAAPILLQLGLPGPLQVFNAQPDARAVFAFPMSIAAMIGVPLFVLVNLLVAWHLFEQRTKQPTRNSHTLKAGTSM